MRPDRTLFAARDPARGRAAVLPVAAAAAPAPSGLLANRDFRLLWAVGLIVFSVRWLEMIVVGVFVYQHTGSPFDVALMTMLRMLPMALFGALIGAAAERIERRTALALVVLAMLGTSLCLAVLANAGWLAVWHLAVASFCNGVAWAADNPMRRVMIGEVVGHDRMGGAMSIMSAPTNPHLGASGIGILPSMDGIGAFCGALAIALFAKPAQYAWLYIGGVAAYLAMLVVFALVPELPLAGTALLFTGVSSAGFSVMQATLIYLSAPPEMRRRMYGVLSVCIGTGPIGFFSLGVLADMVGAPWVTATTGALGLLAPAATHRGWCRLSAAESFDQ
jgi:transmembrane secretion effector